jgi:SNF2 family DNA or RNA helicase
MCRTQAEIGEINFIANDKQQFTSTKNTEILKLIKTTGERFIIFTQFNKLINSINHLLHSNDINALTYPEFMIASQQIKDTTQVIILSSNINASGIDLSFIHNIIIMEPFENYIYGKEIEKQLIGRVHRINQTKKVNVFRLIIKDTIEEVIYSILG